MERLDPGRCTLLNTRVEVRLTSDAVNARSSRQPAYPALLATSGLCVLIALAPLPFGSMDIRIVAVWVALLSMVLFLAALQALGPRDIAFLCGFTAISLAWIVVISEQLGWTALLSRHLTAVIWDEASAILAEQLDRSVSVARNQPLFSAGPQIAFFLSILCGYLVGRDRHAAQMLLICFLGSGLAYAIYGLVALVLWPNYFLWHQKYNYLSSLTATFINPNVAASYFGAVTSGWILYATRFSGLGSHEAPVLWWELIRSRLHATSPRNILHLLACFVTLTTTMLTGSRAGSVLALFCLTGAIGTHLRRKLQRRRLLWIFPVGAVAFVLVAISIFAPRVNQRFGVQGFFDVARWETYASTVEMIKGYPWLGSGLGTFRWIFPSYRSGDVPSYGVWEQAHNTTLELAAEMGLPFTLMVGMWWVAMLAILGRGMLGRNRDAILPTSAFWIGVLAMAHSQVDFPLQIPGFALAIGPILGMGMAQSFSTKGR
ncbi:O-antigen ligase [Bradyrhizobium sp. CCGUVB23]|uniref:O-antigen ligase family protein n=1 Tax=Bradyrhizobium sp. CCGUVB23 TaxID=2949630 RepID=UPI0020B18AED|nr:O-antigen ligase family protein [Bradyrhizobium sp. CCGUVB23]MCP3460080.1 O-antigen ligase family protein [Bradyrhizobium sp. CCGUVB23]